jgi:hypothetical protein
MCNRYASHNKLCSLDLLISTLRLGRKVDINDNIVTMPSMNNIAGIRKQIAP